MITDFSILNNALQVTVGGNKTLFFGCPAKVSPSSDGLQVSVTIENPFPNEPSVFNVLVTDLRISGSGTAPADLATALSSLSTVFPKTNSGSGGSGGTVDSSLSTSSTNPIQNQAVAKKSNDVIIDVAKMYGVVADGATDNTTALMQLRTDCAGANKPAYTFILPKPTGGDGTIRYSNNRWLYGIRSFKLIGPAKLWCTYGGTADDLKLPLWGGDMHYSNNLAFNGMHTFYSGNLLNSSIAGTKTLTLTTSSEASNYAVGMPVYIHGYDQQQGGFPPCDRYLQYNFIEGISSGVLTLRYPIPFALNANWQDRTTNPLPNGKPRIVPLDRSDFTIPTSVEFVDIWYKDNGSGVCSMTFPSLNFTARRCYVEGEVWGTGVNVGNLYDCFFLRADIDKSIGTLNFYDCHTAAGWGAGTGVNHLNFYRCTAAQASYLSPRNLYMEYCLLNTTNGEYSLQQVPNMNPIFSAALKGCKFSSSAGSTNTSHISLTKTFWFNVQGVDSASGNGIYLYESAYQGNDTNENHMDKLAVGTRIFKRDGSAQGYITDIAYDANNQHYTLYGTWRTPTVSEEWMYQAHTNVIDLGGNESLDGKQLWEEESMKWAGNNRVDKTSINTMVFDKVLLRNYMKTGGQINVNSFYGRIIDIVIIVASASTSSDSDVYFEMNFNDLNNSTVYPGRINLKQAGIRTVTPLGSTGLKTGDTIAQSTPTVFDAFISKLTPSFSTPTDNGNGKAADLAIIVRWANI